MPYRVFWPNGVVVEIESAEELVAYEKLRLAAAIAPESQPTTNHPVDSVSTTQESEEYTIEDGWDAYLEILKNPKYAKQRRVLALIKGAGKAGITIQELAQQLRVDGNSAGGTVGAVTKTAGKVGLSAEHIIERREGGRLRLGYLLDRFKPPEGWP